MREDDRRIGLRASVPGVAQGARPTLSRSGDPDFAAEPPEGARDLSGMPDHRRHSSAGFSMQWPSRRKLRFYSDRSRRMIPTVVVPGIGPGMHGERQSWALQLASGRSLRARILTDGPAREPGCPCRIPARVGRSGQGGAMVRR